MSKKTIDVDSMVNELEGSSLYFKKGHAAAAKVAAEGQHLISPTPQAPKPEKRDYLSVYSEK